ncbi:glycosyltransferase family 2 protein, partial [Candidatus Woesearchaeota archaeon]|nr:glycosyltransferase family 2 protein [Candidatus Woesearchaeota archaeon]
MTDVSVIILNWNKPSLTIACVRSVLKQKYPSFNIILVDNGSTDDSVAQFRKAFSSNKRIRIVVNNTNEGYAGGNNVGVQHADGNYVVILNNDTLVQPGWLAELVKALEADPSHAAAESWVLEGDKVHIPLRDRFWTMGLGGYAVLCRGKREPYPKTFYPSGCSFIFRRNLASRPFDPDYFIYAEDTYLGWLLRLRGYHIVTNKKSIVEHQLGTVKRSNPKIMHRFTFLGERNKLTNFLIFPTSWTLLRLLPILFLNIMCINIIMPKKILWRLQAYGWLLAHPGWVYRKRRSVQQQR